MAANVKVLSRIIQAIRKNSSFFIAGHVKPDGDTVGCAIALSSLLRRLGKRAHAYTREAVPDYLKFLPGANKITLADKVRKKFDCAIILECSDLGRMGNLITLDQADTVINIDHHAVFNNFGDINYIDSSASSSAEQVYYLFRQMKMPFTLKEAEALYVGLVTDTGKFQQANTTPDALRMAAGLLEAGVVPAMIYDRLYASYRLNGLRLLGDVLAGMQLAFEGKVAYVKVTKAMYAATATGANDTEGIINYTLSMPQVLVGAMLRETDEPGAVKVSFRSRGNCDVNRIAHHFGGGGHKKAAGCTLKGSLQSAEKQLLDYLTTVFD
jgi:phosphoesterase RecJ-like protein